MQAGGALNGACLVDVRQDGGGGVVVVAEAAQGPRHGAVDDLHHAAAHQSLVLDQGDVRLDAGGVTVHHEADGAGGGEDGRLGVAVAVLPAQVEGLVPDGARRRRGGSGGLGVVDCVGGGAVHLDDTQHRLPVSA